MNIEVKLFKIVLFFLGLLINASVVQQKIEVDQYKDILSKIKNFHLLTEFEKKEFLRICALNEYSVDGVFKSIEDVKRFLVCNTFCKNFIFNDIKFEEYKKALKFLEENKVQEGQSLEYYILWNEFFKKKFNRDLSSAEYKQYFKIALQSGIYSYSDFSELIDWNNCYNKMFNKDISIEQVKAIKSFLEFLKSKKLNLNEEETAKIVYVFLFVGSAKIWKIQKVLEDNSNLEKFKKILLIIHSWNGEFNINWIKKNELESLLKAKDIFVKKGKNFTYLEFESIYIRLQSCPNMNIEQLLEQTKPHLKNKEIIVTKNDDVFIKPQKKNNNQKSENKNDKEFNIRIIENNKNGNNSKKIQNIELKADRNENIKIKIIRSKENEVKQNLELENLKEKENKKINKDKDEKLKDEKKVSPNEALKAFFITIIIAIAVL